MNLLLLKFLMLFSTSFIDVELCQRVIPNSMLDKSGVSTQVREHYKCLSELCSNSAKKNNCIKEGCLLSPRPVNCILNNCETLPLSVSNLKLCHDQVSDICNHKKNQFDKGECLLEYCESLRPNSQRKTKCLNISMNNIVKGFQKNISSLKLGSIAYDPCELLEPEPVENYIGKVLVEKLNSIIACQGNFLKDIESLNAKIAELENHMYNLADGSKAQKGVRKLIKSLNNELLVKSECILNNAFVKGARGALKELLRHHTRFKGDGDSVACTSVRRITDSGIRAIASGGATKPLSIKAKSAEYDPAYPKLNVHYELRGKIPYDQSLGKAARGGAKSIEAFNHKAQESIEGINPNTFLPHAVKVPIVKNGKILIKDRNGGPDTVRMEDISGASILNYQVEPVYILGDITSINGSNNEIVREWTEAVKMGEIKVENKSAQERVELFKHFVGKKSNIQENTPKDYNAEWSYNTAKPFGPDADLFLSAIKQVKNYEHKYASSKKKSQGTLSLLDEKMAKHINRAIGNMGNFQNIVHHGPEDRNIYFPQELKNDYPIKFYCSDEKIYTIPKGPKGKEHKELIKFYNKMNKNGFKLRPNFSYLYDHKEEFKKLDFSSFQNEWNDYVKKREQQNK